MADWSVSKKNEQLLKARKQLTASQERISAMQQENTQEQQRLRAQVRELGKAKAFVSKYQASMDERLNSADPSILGLCVCVCVYVYA